MTVPSNTDCAQILSGRPCARVAEYVRTAREAYRTPGFAGGEGSIIWRYSREDPFGPDPHEDVPDAAAGFDDAMPRLHAIPGLRNVRDIGGWTGLAAGRVFRGSQLKRTDGPDGICYATREGLLGNLGLQTELDLRGNAEWGVIDYGETSLADMSKAGLARVNVAFPSYLALFDPANAESVARAVRLFADPATYPVYVHCAGGADRTGALVLILEALCGADEADIDVDYELTSFAVIYGLRHRDETERLKWKSMKDAFRAAAPESPTFGTAVESWCRRFLGLTDAELASIRGNLK